MERPVRIELTAFVFVARYSINRTTGARSCLMSWCQVQNLTAAPSLPQMRSETLGYEGVIKWQPKAGSNRRFSGVGATLCR